MRNFKNCLDDLDNLSKSTEWYLGELLRSRLTLLTITLPGMPQKV